MALQKQFEQDKMQYEQREHQHKREEQQRLTRADRIQRRQQSARQLITPSSSVDRSLSSSSRDELIVPEMSEGVQAAPPSPQDVVRRARPVMRRSHSSSKDATDYPSGSLDRPSRNSLQFRTSIYASGTQSAYTSRDASPEKGMRMCKGRSPYPAPPPSFLITPPRSPRHFCPSPHTHILTSENMIKLYEKLGEIERTEEETEQKEISQSVAIVKERKAGLRVLTKSMSVDATDEDPPWLEGPTSLPERMSYIELKKHSETYQDAPLSQTLPASIRIGELVITPGIEKLNKNFGPEMYVAAGLISPRSQRRKFYESTPVDVQLSTPDSGAKSKKYVSFDDNLLKKDAKFIKGPRKAASISIRDGKVAEVKTYDQETGKEKSIGEKASAFFSSVREKRKLFGMKRASSVDNSAISSSVALAGVQAARPAAPSTYDPPPIKVERPVSKKKGLHKRAASLDIPSFFKSSSSSGSKSDISSSTTASSSKSEDSRKFVKGHEPGKKSSSKSPSGSTPDISSRVTSTSMDPFPDNHSLVAVSLPHGFRFFKF